ncbi:hypothetical protein [Rhizobium sp. 007]|uniref:hypothetical protein n=1 Tax=Rhizobium sp. 007 TaxID=2785056 RepID=UPI00188E3BCE|nr:hypothetical protein [Rhizobium sp. 007]QPB24781.1 hypothetical protein ISN39_35665 [Rhizobium sp. 007]
MQSNPCADLDVDRVRFALSSSMNCPFLSTGFDIFDTFKAAKNDVVTLRQDILRQHEVDWVPMPIEKIVIAPMNRQNLLTLFKMGFEAVVTDHEVIVIIE